MSKPLIVIDPGHRGGDPGAVGYVKEADVAYQIGKYTQKALEDNYICETYITSGTDSTKQRAAKANKRGAVLFLSIHLDAFKPEVGDGWTGLVYSAKNKELGKIFEKHVKAAGQNSRGVKYRPDLNVLKFTNMAAILNECAFVDTKKDIEDWNEPHEWKKMGEALAEAAAEFSNLQEKGEKTETGVYKITVSALNVRSGPGMDYKKVTKVKKGDAYTIVEISGNWGKLKSGAGWINISEKYCKRM